MPSHADRWKNRRKMAWAALVSGLGFPLLLLATDSSQLGAVAGPFYIFVGAVVGAYIGFATVDDKWTQDARHETHIDRYGGGSSGFGPNGMDGERLASERPDRFDEGYPRHGSGKGY